VGRPRDAADKEVATRRVSAGRRTYFLDLKISEGDQFYLVLVESKIVGKDKETGKLKRERYPVQIFEDTIGEFTEAFLDLAVEVIGEDHTAFDRFRGEE